MTDRLAEIRALLAGASAETEIVYVATARAKLNALTSDVEDVARLVKARELEIARRARDVAQVPMFEREDSR